jgi:hypothetical protein
MQLLLTLLIAHLFADFPLQTNRLAQYKEKHWQGVFLHVLVHIGVTMLMVTNIQHYWPLILGLGAVHFVIDTVKLIYPGKKGVLYFLIDQLLHLITIAIAAHVAQQLWPALPGGVLPDQWLLYVLVAALIPALMVLFWIWTNNLSQEYVAQVSVLQWSKRQLLGVEQRLGLAIMGVVFLEAAIYSYIGIIQQIWQ